MNLTNIHGRNAMCKAQAMPFLNAVRLYAPTPCGIITDIALDPLIINGFEEFLNLLDNQTFCLT